MSAIGIDVVGRYAAALTATEIGLGSFLHSMHIPFSGNFLSLNQGFLLARGVWRHQDRGGVRTLPARISGISAVLKSLSPAGKRLTPMLAIAAQGFWFSTGTILFGPNLLGVLFGMTLLCVWPFVQPLLIYYLLFGNTLLDAFQYCLLQVQRHVSITESHVLRGFVAIVTIKIVLGAIVAVLSRTLADSTEARMDNFLRRRIPGMRLRTWHDCPNASIAARGALRELLNPLFVFSFAVTLFFFINAELPQSKSIWILLRPLAIGFLSFFLVRLIPNRFFPPSFQATLTQLKERA